jgi:hypothetical protein
MTPDSMNFALHLSIVLASIIIVAVVCGSTLVAMGIRKAGPDDGRLLTTFFEHGTLLQIIAAVSIIGATLLLRILDLIQSEAAVSILSGTSGYILGGLTSRSRTVGNAG